MRLNPEGPVTPAGKHQPGLLKILWPDKKIDDMMQGIYP